MGISNTAKIIAKIEQLELEKAKLLDMRKEEIFQVLEKSGGLAIDNRLLAGLSRFASDPKNAGSSVLKELVDLGKGASGSRPSRKSVKKKTEVIGVSETAAQKEKVDG